jgi:hypothetical protein
MFLAKTIHMGTAPQSITTNRLPASCACHHVVFGGALAAPIQVE